MSAVEKWNGNTMGGERVRNTDDAYFTPPKLAEAICRRLRDTIGEMHLIVEPSAGAGTFIEAARRHWLTARIGGVEPNPPQRFFDLLGANVFSIASRLSWEQENTLIDEAITESPRVLILGNPPFLLAEEHVRLALSRLGHDTATEPQPRYLSFLLRASFLAGDKRARGLHLGVGGLRYVWHVVGRPSFTGDGKTDGAEYCVAVWQAGYRGPYEGGWLTWR